MHEAHEGRPDLSPDQGTPGDDAAAQAEDAARQRITDDLETTARLGLQIGELLTRERIHHNRVELDVLVPAWARRFNAEHAGETWEVLDYPETIARYAQKRFDEWNNSPSGWQGRRG